MSIFQLNQTCFRNSSSVMGHGFFLYDLETKHQSSQWKTLPRLKKSKSVKDVLQYERHLPQWVLARARWSISKSTRRSCSICFTQCMRRDKSCGKTNRGCFTITMHLPQHTEPPAVPDREEYWCTGKTSLFSCSCSMWLFFYLSTRRSSSGPILKA